MKLNKIYVFISVLLFFWIVVIAAGIFRKNNPNPLGNKSVQQGQSAATEKKGLVETIGDRISSFITGSKADNAEKKGFIDSLGDRFALLIGTKEKATPASEAKTEEPKTALAGGEIPAIMVRTTKVKAVDFEDNLPVMGTVKGKTEVELRFEINGVIRQIKFREGERIKKGDIIACLDPKDAQLQLNYARNKFNSMQAAANSAQKRLEIHQKLYDAGAILKSKLEEISLEYDSAKYQVETARSEVQIAQHALTKSCIIAKKDGVMGKREAEEGEFITPQEKLGYLYEIGEVYVEVGVVERDIEKIKIGQKAKVYVDAAPNIAFEGVVESIFPAVEGKSRTLTVKINVSNPEEKLLPGMFSRAEIRIAELKNAIMVPSTSIISMGRGVTLIPAIPQESIKTVGEGIQIGTVALRQAKLGYITSDFTQITEGLDSGDLVVTQREAPEGSAIQDGEKARIIGIEELAF